MSNYSKKIMTVEKEKKRMLRELKLMSIRDKNVLNAIDQVPRHLFVPEGQKELAYEDMPLPIPGGQTISQPYTVAFMLEQLELKKDMNVLEIGAGSGWNAALIAKIVSSAKVFSIEFDPGLAEFAKKNLKKARISNVEIMQGDGSKGYPDKAPFDRIIATCACPRIPAAWVDQLKEDGIIIAPVGRPHGQNMQKIRKKNGKLIVEHLGEFMFVPLRGESGY